MKAVMISIQPKWVEKIASGEKTIEVRKTAPKCEEPFKCYIYCTSAKPYLYKEANPPFELFFDSELYKGKGYDDRLFSSKVIGEFVCYSAEWMSMRDCDKACMTLKEAVDYGKGKKLYAWHISDLKIYDKPKELSEFKRPLDMPTCGYTECGTYETPYCKWLNTGCEKRIITRAPQSWQYVEELEDEN